MENIENHIGSTVRVMENSANFREGDIGVIESYTHKPGLTYIPVMIKRMDGTIASILSYKIELIKTSRKYEIKK